MPGFLSFFRRLPTKNVSNQFQRLPSFLSFVPHSLFPLYFLHKISYLGGYLTKKNTTWPLSFPASFPFQWFLPLSTSPSCPFNPSLREKVPSEGYQHLLSLSHPKLHHPNPFQGILSMNTHSTYVAVLVTSNSTIDLSLSDQFYCCFFFIQI